MRQDRGTRDRRQDIEGLGLLREMAVGKLSKVEHVLEKKEGKITSTRRCVEAMPKKRARLC